MRERRPRADPGEVFAIAHGEMVELAARGRPLVRRALALALQVPARALARSLVALDDDLARGAIAEAARARLRHHGALDRFDPGTTTPPRAGPLLVVANHPGLFDALALFAALDREDLAILAARRPLLASLPNLSARLLLIDPGASGAVALRKALRHLRAGGALLHFPAGRIEPDPRVSAPGTPLLLPWKGGLATLLDAAARLVPALRVSPALVSGVISRRALRLARAAGGDDLTSALVPLVQLTFPGFGDSAVRVRFGPDRAVGEVTEAQLRDALQRLAGAR